MHAICREYNLNMMCMLTGRKERCGRLAGTGSLDMILLSELNNIICMDINLDRVLQVFVRKVIELHDKYLAYVNDCFMNHTLFHKVCTTA